MMKINLLTVCTEAYPLVYAEKLIKRLCKLSHHDITPYCMTDRPEQVNGWANPIIADPDSRGWWHKVNLFDPNMPSGWNLYLDIDIVVLNEFDEELEWTISKNPSIACVADAINWMGVKFNSSLMVFETGSQESIHKSYSDKKSKLQTRPGGDQVWTGPQLSNVMYINDEYPNLKKNLKFDLALATDGANITLPSTISGDIKMIDCSGRPKPHELMGISYIRDAWGEVS